MDRTSKYPILDCRNIDACSEPTNTRKTKVTDSDIFNSSMRHTLTTTAIEELLRDVESWNGFRDMGGGVVNADAFIEELETELKVRRHFSS